MKWLKDKLILFAAVLATRKTVPERWSLSDDPATRPNFTYLRFFEEEEGMYYDFLVREIVPRHGFEGIHFDQQGNGYSEASIRFSSIDNPKFRIERMYRLVSVQYDSPLQYICGELTFKHVRAYLSEKRKQAKFKKSFKFRADRMQVLTEIVEFYRSKWRDDSASPQSQFRFSSIDMFSRICSEQVWGHPNVQLYLGEFTLVLDSLVASGDLKKRELEYWLDGKALRTLSKYAEEERRHQDSENHNRAIRGLTWVLIFVTLLGVAVQF